MDHKKAKTICYSHILVLLCTKGLCLMPYSVLPPFMGWFCGCPHNKILLVSTDIEVDLSEVEMSLVTVTYFLYSFKYNPTITYYRPASFFEFQSKFLLEEKLMHLRFGLYFSGTMRLFYRRSKFLRTSQADRFSHQAVDERYLTPQVSPVYPLPFADFLTLLPFP